ncbi:MAG: thiol-disulfide oxidoreductase DCC family protein [Bacteroidia bacterium]|nr:thiol-disulfide oxidoreductase DCC family protein [Bacteroidia bacterium]
MEDVGNLKIVLFDGVCNLCSSSVQWIIQHDPKAQFSFASLQSEMGEKLKTQFGILPDIDSVVLIENNTAFYQSDAALRIVKNTSGAWKFLYGFIVVPKFIRNFVYNFIAKNRYKWFGKKNECWLPNPELQSRFL